MGHPKELVELAKELQDEFDIEVRIAEEGSALYRHDDYLCVLGVQTDGGDVLKVKRDMFAGFDPSDRRLLTQAMVEFVRGRMARLGSPEESDDAWRTMPGGGRQTWMRVVEMPPEP